MNIEIIEMICTTLMWVSTLAFLGYLTYLIRKPKKD